MSFKGITRQRYCLQRYYSIKGITRQRYCSDLKSDQYFTLTRRPQGAAAGHGSWHGIYLTLVSTSVAVAACLDQPDPSSPLLPPALQTALLSDASDTARNARRKPQADFVIYHHLNLQTNARDGLDWTRRCMVWWQYLGGLSTCAVHTTEARWCRSPSCPELLNFGSVRCY